MLLPGKLNGCNKRGRAEGLRFLLTFFSVCSLAKSKAWQLHLLETKNNRLP